MGPILPFSDSKRRVEVKRGKGRTGRLTSRIRGVGAGEGARAGEEEAGPEEEEAGPTEVEVLSLRGLRERFAVPPSHTEEETFRFGAMMGKRARKKKGKGKGGRATQQRTRRGPGGQRGRREVECLATLKKKRKKEERVSKRGFEPFYI